MVKIVSDACRVEGDKLIMVLESDKLSELVDNRVAKFAIENAYRFGWSDACLNGQSTPAPVGPDGKISDDYEALIKAANDKNVKYRKEVYIVHRMG